MQQPRYAITSARRDPERDTYEHYRQFCRRLGVAPLSFEDWSRQRGNWDLRVNG